MNVFGVLKQNRSYIFWSGVIFFLGWLLGGLFPNQLFNLVADQIDHIRELAEKTQANDSALYTCWVIFKNNLFAAIVMIVSGIAFGIFTVLALLMNGMMIGVVFGVIGAHAGVSYWKTVMFGLLPHGIFELTAIFIAAAFGLKLGRVLIVPLKEKTRLQSFGYVWREIARAGVVVLVLLVVAASVEGTITPFLLHTFVKI
ncbi:MAG: stage II sporulation protein M [Tumebacillaceae bacterium]